MSPHPLELFRKFIRFGGAIRPLGSNTCAAYFGNIWLYVYLNIIVNILCGGKHKEVASLTANKHSFYCRSTLRCSPLFQNFCTHWVVHLIDWNCESINILQKVYCDRNACRL